jgi:prepilin-type N-terminal cleavage/methylation domain-containing protein
MKRKDEGFTLIELLIVIVILGILAAVVVFAVNGITDRGEKSACKADYETMGVALEAYNAQTGDYPPAPAAGDNDDSELTTPPDNLLRIEDVQLRSGRLYRRRNRRHSEQGGLHLAPDRLDVGDVVEQFRTGLPDGVTRDS